MYSYTARVKYRKIVSSELIITEECDYTFKARNIDNAWHLAPHKIAKMSKAYDGKTIFNAKVTAVTRVHNRF